MKKRIKHASLRFDLDILNQGIDLMAVSWELWLNMVYRESGRIFILLLLFDAITKFNASNNIR